MQRSGQPSALLFKINQLGDNVVFLPVVQKLAADRACETLTLWTTPVASPLYENLLHGIRLELSTREQFYPAWKNPLTLPALIRRARKARATHALVAEDMGNTAYFLALTSGAGARVGTLPPYLKIPFAINDPVTLPPDAPAAEKAWTLGSALAARLGGAPWPAAPPPPDLTHLISPAQTRCDILIHPGASRAYQRWPFERFEALARRLAADFRVGWIETPEVPAAPTGPFDIHRPRSLGELVSLIAGASLFVANNSGPMHVASALGTPSVIPVGSSARSWNPYWHAERFRLLRHETLPCIACDPPGLPILERCTNDAHPMACMDFWTVEKVEAEVRAWHAAWAKPTPRPL